MEVHPSVVSGDDGREQRLRPAADEEDPAPLLGAEGRPNTMTDSETEDSWTVIQEEDPKMTLEDDSAIDFSNQRLEIMLEEPETMTCLKERRPVAALKESLRAEVHASAEIKMLTPKEDDSVTENHAEKSWKMFLTEDWQHTLASTEEEIRPITPAEGGSETVSPSEETLLSVSLVEEDLRAVALVKKVSEIPGEENSMTISPANKELSATTCDRNDSQTVTPVEEKSMIITHGEEDTELMAHTENGSQTVSPGGEKSKSVTHVEDDRKPFSYAEGQSTTMTPAEEKPTTVTSAEGGMKAITPVEEPGTIISRTTFSLVNDDELTVMASAEEESKTMNSAEENLQSVIPAKQESLTVNSAKPTTATHVDPEPGTPSPAPGRDPTTQLLVAAAAAEIEECGARNLVKELAEAGADLEATSTQAEEEGLRALHLACWGGNATMVKQLLHLGADATSLARGRQPVHWAAYGGHMGALEALAAVGVSLSARTARDGSTPLHLAVENGNEEAALWLVKRGVSVLARRADGAQAAGLAREARHWNLHAYLTGRGKAEQLLTAAATGPVEAVQQLLARGTDVNVCSYIESTKGWSALHVAAEGNQLETVEALLGAGANVGAKTLDGQTAIQVAARAGNLQVVQVLLPRLQGHVMDELGLGLVQATAEGGDVFIMQYLDSCGYDIHARSRTGGQTALHVAARLGHVQLAGWLIEEGFSAEEKDAAGLTPLNYAWMEEQAAVLHVLAFHRERSVIGNAGEFV